MKRFQRIAQELRLFHLGVKQDNQAMTEYHTERLNEIQDEWDGEIGGKGQQSFTLKNSDGIEVIVEADFLGGFHIITEGIPPTTIQLVTDWLEEEV